MQKQSRLSSLPLILAVRAQMARVYSVRVSQGTSTYTQKVLVE